MMDKNIVAFVIVACFVVCQIVETNSTEAITLNQLVGEWYSIGRTSRNNNAPNNFECLKMNITKEKMGRQQNFQIHNTFSLHGVSNTSTGYGTIINNEVTFLFPYSNLKYAFNVEWKYDNGRELLLKNNWTGQRYTIWSRSPSISEEAKLKLEQLAAETGTKIFYINHSGCSYNDSII